MSPLPATAAWVGILPPAFPLACLRHPREELPYPLGEAGCALHARSRHSIWHGVRELGLDPGDEVLVPAYNCGEEVEALLRAGFSCRFYDATETLAPDRAELEALLGPRTRALYLIHYLGFPQDAPGWRRWCDEHGLVLVEDAAQAWLAEIEGRPVGSFGDTGVVSLYKTLGVPDGSALVVRGRSLAGPGPLPLTRGAVTRMCGRWFGSRSSWLARAGTAPLKLRRLRQARRAPAGPVVHRFELGNPDTPPSGLTRLLLPRLADARVAERRRSNYLVLLDALAELVPPPYRRLPAGASPFAFPLEPRPNLSERLARAGILAVRLWRSPHPVIPVGPFPKAGTLREGVLILPVHQELAAGDLERIARAVRGR